MKSSPEKFHSRSFFFAFSYCRKRFLLLRKRTQNRASWTSVTLYIGVGFIRQIFRHLQYLLHFNRKCLWVNLVKFHRIGSCLDFGHIVGYLHLFYPKNAIIQIHPSALTKPSQSAKIQPPPISGILSFDKSTWSQATNHTLP